MLRFVPIWFKKNLNEDGTVKRNPRGDIEYTVHGKMVFNTEE